MNILVTLNSNYIEPLKVMLKSMFMNNSHEKLTIYLMHSSIKPEELADINEFVESNGQNLIAITLKDEYFSEAPVLMHYTKEMYYRLLAYKFLPADLDRILYLDPDILVINEIRSLYDLDLSGYLYAAAYHELIPVKEINRLRLKTYEMEEYFNSGVLLMNLALQRKEIDERRIYEFVIKYKNRLILPDQDILNSLYAKHIKKIDEIKYNYDTRYYRYNKIISKGVVDMDYVINNTSILHFCGKKKPWHKNYTGSFHSLYKHYQKITLARFA